MGLRIVRKLESQCPDTTKMVLVVTGLLGICSVISQEDTGRYTVCDEIIHLQLVGFLVWQSRGVARFDLADHDNDGITSEWIDPLTDGGNNGLSDDDPAHSPAMMPIVYSMWA